MILKGEFTSSWDCGDTTITTAATLDTETGELVVEQTHVDDLKLFNLDREYFTDEDDETYEVCPECHEYILKTVMVDGIGSTLEEKQSCMNPYCENHL